MVKLFASSGDPDQMPQSAGLHCLPITPGGSPDYNRSTAGSDQMQQNV